MTTTSPVGAWYWGEWVGLCRVGQAMWALPRWAGMTEALGWEDHFRDADEAMEAAWRGIYAEGDPMGRVAEGFADVSAKLTYVAGFVVVIEAAGGAIIAHGPQWAAGMVETAGATMTSPWVAIPTAAALSDMGASYGRASYYSAMAGNYYDAVVFGGDGFICLTFATSTGQAAMNRLSTRWQMETVRTYGPPRPAYQQPAAALTEMEAIQLAKQSAITNARRLQAAGSPRKFRLS